MILQVLHVGKSSWIFIWGNRTDFSQPLCNWSHQRLGGGLGETRHPPRVKVNYQYSNGKIDGTVLTYWFIFGPFTNLRFGISAIYFDVKVYTIYIQYVSVCIFFNFGTITCPQIFWTFILVKMNLNLCSMEHDLVFSSSKTSCPNVMWFSCMACYKVGPLVINGVTWGPYKWLYKRRNWVFFDPL